jgi:thiamine biosynthesis lipoprotein
MRCASLWLALVVSLAVVSLRAADLAVVSVQRYCMGTMFDIVAYHSSRADAERAIAKAMDEIVHLDQVMSHYKPDSSLSRLNREGGAGFVVVEPSLYDVIQQSISFSRLTGGRFDATIAPLLSTWKEAHAEGRLPSAAEISDARRCVGFENIEMRAPDRIRFRSDCVKLDLGGIGKGYAVDRAVAVLESEGIRSALVNAGGSSIASIGSPPGGKGWPVRLAANVSARNTLLLRGNSISTSQQVLVSHAFAPGGFGEIIDPRTGAPTASEIAVSVVARSATVADALSTALLMVPIDEATTMLGRFPDVSAIWVSRGGRLHAAYGESRLQLSNSP